MSANRLNQVANHVRYSYPHVVLSQNRLFISIRVLVFNPLVDHSIHILFSLSHILSFIHSFLFCHFNDFLIFSNEK